MKYTGSHLIVIVNGIISLNPHPLYNVKHLSSPYRASILNYIETKMALLYRARSEPSRYYLRGFPGGAVVENLPANAGDTGSSPGLGRSHMPQSN